MRHPVTPCTITTTAVVKGRRTLPILIAPFTSTYFLKAMVAAVKQLIQTVLFASYKCYKNCTVLILEVRIKLVYFSTPAHNAEIVNTVDSLNMTQKSGTTFFATSYSKIALISPKKYCEIPANNYKKQKKKPISNF